MTNALRTVLVLTFAIAFAGCTTSSRINESSEVVKERAEVQRQRTEYVERERLIFENEQARLREKNYAESERKFRESDAKREAQVAEFRARVKGGDRFSWKSQYGKVVGLVIRIEGPLAFVQFDNLTVSGQQTRYIPKDQLEPFDGKPPMTFYNVQ